MNLRLFTDWIQEVDYIRDIAKVRGDVKEFNFDVDCFLRYCIMQANYAPPVFATQINLIIGEVQNEHSSVKAS